MVSMRATMSVVAVLFGAGLVERALAHAEHGPGDVISAVEGQPPVTQGQFDHWMRIAAARGAGVGGFVPDRPTYARCAERLEETKAGRGRTLAQRRATCAHRWRVLRDQVLGFLVAGTWLRGEAAEQGVVVTEEQIDKAFARQKRVAFPTQAAFQEFLRTSRSTEADIRLQLEVEQLQQALVAKITKAGASKAKVEAYYRANREEFVIPAGRDTLNILTSTKTEAWKARRALEQGRRWAAVAEKYDVLDGDELRVFVTRGDPEDPAFSRAVFRAPLRTLVGPVEGEFGWYVFEVRRRQPAERMSLREAAPVIRAILERQAIEDFVKDYRARWLPRTTCHVGFVIKDCGGPMPTAAPPSA